MYGQHWKTVQVVCGIGLLAFVLIGTNPLCAQVQVGENVKMSLNGNLGAGYAGTFGNFAGNDSSHGHISLRTGELVRLLPRPQVLQLFVQPFYNRNQDNGSFGSVFSETGINASVTSLAEVISRAQCPTESPSQKEASLASRALPA